MPPPTFAGWAHMWCTYKHIGTQAHINKQQENIYSYCLLNVEIQVLCVVVASHISNVLRQKKCPAHTMRCYQ